LQSFANVCRVHGFSLQKLASDGDPLQRYCCQGAVCAQVELKQFFGKKN